ncbi:MAG: hypothetical protein ABIG03_02060 [Candidatus Eisenbacteria bacterium]
MRNGMVLACALLLSLAPFGAGVPRAEESGLPDEELLVLRVCEGVTELFEEQEHAIWSGYSLARQPFMVYVPDRWAVLLNVDEAPEGFGPPPADWPALGHNASYHEGTYGTLVGQLAFDVSVGSAATVAVGLPSGFSEKVEHPAVDVFSYVVHEAFHQYQHEAFGQMPWEREEKYPISDVENSALAWLEMRLLEEALEALEAGDANGCRDLTRTFAAVRQHRWDTADPFVRRYEQYKELLEGTAKYVELRCLELMPAIEYVSTLDAVVSPLANSFTRLPMPGLLLQELRERMGDGCLRPEDIPRNRIYSVASAQAFLLDHLGVEWKEPASRAGTEFTYVGLLADHLELGRDEAARLVEEAKNEHDFRAILAKADEARSAYLEDYAHELASFEGQEGMRVEVLAPSSGLSRSRVSRDRKWLADSGRYCLCSLFEVYTLETSGWMLQLHDAGLLEINDWDAGHKTIVFYDTDVRQISIDGAPASSLLPGARDFDTIEMAGDRFALESEIPGRIEVTESTARLSF